MENSCLVFSEMDSLPENIPRDNMQVQASFNNSLNNHTVTSSNCLELSDVKIQQDGISLGNEVGDKKISVDNNNTHMHDSNVLNSKNSVKSENFWVGSAVQSNGSHLNLTSTSECIINSSGAECEVPGNVTDAENFDTFEDEKHSKDSPILARNKTGSIIVKRVTAVTPVNESNMIKTCVTDNKADANCSAPLSNEAAEQLRMSDGSDILQETLDTLNESLDIIETVENTCYSASDEEIDNECLAMDPDDKQIRDSPVICMVYQFNDAENTPDDRETVDLCESEPPVLEIKETKQVNLNPPSAQVKFFMRSKSERTDNADSCEVSNDNAHEKSNDGLNSAIAVEKINGNAFAMPSSSDNALPNSIINADNQPPDISKTRTLASDGLNSSDPNYNMIQVSEFSLFTPNSNAKDFVGSINSNMSKIIKQEENCAIVEYDFPPILEAEEDYRIHDEAVVVKELAATLNNILSGTAFVHKYIDNNCEHWEVINQNGGSRINITGLNNDINDKDSDTGNAMRILSYLDKHNANSSDSANVKSCYVKLNRVAQDEENEEEIPPLESTVPNPDENKGGRELRISSRKLTPPVAEVSPKIKRAASKTELTCDVCHVSYHTKYHFDTHICRYCVLCKKSFLSLKGFKNHQNHCTYSRKLNCNKPSATATHFKSVVSQKLEKQTPVSKSLSVKRKITKSAKMATGSQKKKMVFCEVCELNFHQSHFNRHRCVIYHLTNASPPVFNNNSPANAAASSKKETVAKPPSTQNTSISRMVTRPKPLRQTGLPASTAQAESVTSELNPADNKDYVVNNKRVKLDPDEGEMGTLPQTTPVLGPRSLTLRSPHLYCHNCKKQYPNRAAFKKHRLKVKCGALQLHQGDKLGGFSEEIQPESESIYEQNDSKIDIPKKTRFMQKRSVFNVNQLAASPLVGKMDVINRRRRSAPLLQNKQKQIAEKKMETSFQSPERPITRTATSGRKISYAYDDEMDYFDVDEEDEPLASFRNDRSRHFPESPFSDESEQKARQRYSCNYCYMIFSSFPQYKSHVQMHIEENLHECPYCLESFPSSFALNNHVHQHIQNARIVCRECGERFPSQKHYFKHMLQKHSA